MKKIIICLITFLSASTFAQENRVLIIGDSLTEGYGVAQKDAYPARLEQILRANKKSFSVINAGSSGSTSASAVTRMKWHMRKTPKIVVLALGANDGLRGTPVEATKKNLGKAIDIALKKKVIVYLAGMKIPMNYGKKYRADFEKVFTELVKEKKIKFIPFLLKDVGGEPHLNLADGIHPNEKGHKKIAETVFEAIKGDL